MDNCLPIYLCFLFITISSLLFVYLSICSFGRPCFNTQIPGLVNYRVFVFTFFFMEPQEWETSKENVLPLRQGRSANTLNQALQNGTPQRNPIVEKKIRFRRE